MKNHDSKLAPVLRAMDAYERRNAPEPVVEQERAYRPLHLQYLRQQYLGVKRQYPDAMVCFRVGDFYELFESDAEIAARELGITVTKRDLGWGKRTLMAGFPWRVAQGYIDQLVARGHRVAVCEQVSHGSPEPVETVQPVSLPESDEYGYWTRRPDGGLHYHAYDPATEDDEDELRDHLIDERALPTQEPVVTCHLCGAPVEADALDVQTAADGSLMWEPLCAAHLVAGTKRLLTAIQREGGVK